MSGPRAGHPVALTSFVGREHELAQARELVLECRLVTFTGVGGSGKTRLALELAGRLERRFSGGTALAELASVADPSFIAQVIAQAVGVVESTGPDPEAALVMAVRESELLLVVDNCEHVVDRCASLLERLLTLCPGLHVLATSREPLNVPGEVSLPVPPLTTPSPDRLSTARELEVFEAARLFADRAAAVHPGFAVDDANAQAVARICSRLDGLPLGIELAAARARSMSPDEIVLRLDMRLSRLFHGARTAAPRQQTLRAAIDWSYDLLARDERILFRRLSVFAGGWTLADAESVCADEILPHDAIADVHSRVADKSLIKSKPISAGTSRHQFLEMIRQYATERLEEAGETDLIRRHHFVHFLGLAEQYDDDRMIRGSDSGLPAIAAHRDNFRAALAWGADVDPEGSLRLTSALDDFWRMISATEGWGWLQRTLQGMPDDNPHRLRALLSAGMLAAYVPAYSEGTGLLRAAVVTARQANDRSSEAWARLWLGRLAFFGEDVSGAEEHLRSALTLHKEMDNPLGCVRSLALLGLLEAVILGRRTEGEQKLEAAADLAHDIEDSWGEGYAHMMLGICGADAADSERVRIQCRIALQTASLGPLLGVPLQQLARVCVEEDPARALRLMGAAAGHFQRTGTAEPAFLERRAESVLHRAAQILGAEGAARHFEAGRKLTTGEAIAFADEGPKPARRGPGGLTQREMQVASLVGRYQTNREIAGILFISVRTAESHVEHILAKLGLGNRLELAAWARGHDLVAGEKNP